MKKRLPNKEFRELVASLKENKQYEDKQGRKIDWPAYTLQQINEAKELISFINKIVDKVEYMDINKRGRQLTDPKILAKCILISECLGLPERKAQGWTWLLGPRLGFYEEIDDRVLGEAYARPEVAYILKQVYEETKHSDGVLGGDGTGLESTRKENYESNNDKQGGYLTCIVDSREVVQAFNIEGEDEREAMKQLIEEVDGDSLRLDAGFVDRELVARIDRLGMIPYIYPKKNLKLNGRQAWKDMLLSFFLDVTSWLREYYQRVHCESFYSSFKRVFGPVTKHRFSCRLTQITARIIIHNFRRLSYFKLVKN